jgi:hypothetical protein
MSTIRFNMAGSGNWQSWFCDDRAISLYRRIYNEIVHLRQLPDEDQNRVRHWLAPSFVVVRAGAVVPLIPVLTNADVARLTPWLSHVTDAGVAIIAGQAGRYRELANIFSAERSVPADYLLTILLCAYTLDLGALGHLHRGLLGQPPDRAGTGRYFLWGETTDLADRYDFGVNSYPVIDGGAVSVILCPKVKRVMPDLCEVRIPVLDRIALGHVQDLCGPVSQKLARAFTDNLDPLRACVGGCSFANCSAPDYLCMLFHISYGRLTKALVERGLLPEFPAHPADNWGMWIRAIL